jgi:uncharacterized membrane protein YccF (DUF307 family)
MVTRIRAACSASPIIGIPFGVASFKMAAAALAPLGNEIVRKSGPDDLDRRHAI